MGRYAENGLLIKVNSDMAHISGETRVDWANLPDIKGGLFRLGKISGTARPQEYECDYFMDLSEKSNRTSLIQNKKLAIGYIEVDPACWLDRGWTSDSVDSLMDGTISEVCQKLITYEPHLYLLARKTKQGAGRVFNIDKLKTLQDWDADGWCWLLNKYWRSDNSTIGDGWISKTMRIILDGAKLLSDNGYIPKQSSSQIVETSEWFLYNYGNLSTRDVIARQDAIPQGNFWKENRDGLLNCENSAELVSLFNTIPDSFQIENVGAGIPGKIVVGYKVASNITMPQVLNASGNKIQFDVISMKINQNETINRYPSYKARLNTEVPPPAKKKYFIPSVARNMRPIPSTENNIAIGAASPNSKILVEAEADNNGYHWIQTRVWVATNFGNKYYGKFIEE